MKSIKQQALGFGTQYGPNGPSPSLGRKGTKRGIFGGFPGGVEIKKETWQVAVLL